MLLPEPMQHAGVQFLEELAAVLATADPDGSIEPRSRLLCAALGTLAQSAYRALGGERAAPAVGVAAAALSLLTKLDDEVIDSFGFHRGAQEPRGDVRRRTARFLAPTLRSIRCAHAATDEPRCALAGDVGRRFRQLIAAEPGHSSALRASRSAQRERAAVGTGIERTTPEERLEALVRMIERGWQIQVDSVVVLTSHPREVTAPEVARVTRAISGAWLTMMALVGTLPEDAQSMTSDEVEAVFDWGGHIQRADALADLEKDHREGLLSTFVLKALWDRHRVDPGRATTRSLYRAIAGHGIDCEVFVTERRRAELAARLARLPEVASTLDWIDRMLLGRYLDHRWCACARPPSWHTRRPVRSASVGTPVRRRQEARPCSAH